MQDAGAPVTRGLFAIAFLLTGCGGDGDGGGSSPATPTIPGPSISITTPTSESTSSQVCNSEVLGGTAGFGSSASCCQGSAEQLSGVRVTWTNTTTGATGAALQIVHTCPIFLICDHTWSALIPLVLGNNLIRVSASDTRTGGTSSATITVNKPILTYVVSGSFASHLGASPGNAHSTLQVTRVGADATKSANVQSTGSYSLSCVPDGVHALTPSSTINYAFSPASRSVTVAGGDVSGQDFTAQAFGISGTVSFANSGASAPGQAIGLSGSGSTATAFTASDGTYGFLVPNGSYTLTPTDLLGLPAQTTPLNRMVTINNVNVPAQDFVRP
jgi:hypothetical protein